MKKAGLLVGFLLCIISQVIFASSINNSNIPKLRVYEDKAPRQLVYETSNYDEIASALNAINVQFEKWEANKELPENAQENDILAAYKDDVERLVNQNDYKFIDVLKLTPDNPNKTQLRQKFINEHTHAEDEVRFFVEGSGLFYLHAADHVYLVKCERDDLISVPANYPHWFDMSGEPFLTVIRFFKTRDGWVASFTESDIAQNYPKYGD